MSSTRSKILQLLKEKNIETVSHQREFSLSILYINLDEKCNQNCVFCVVKGANVGKFGSMKTEEAKKLIRRFINSGGDTIIFTGGEPTLRNDLPQLIRYAERLRHLKNISVITNGVRLADNTYFTKLIKADQKKILNFSISLHSHRESVSDFLTATKGSYKKTINGIKNARKYQRQVSIYQVITTKNYKDLVLFCKFLNKNFPEIRTITFAYPFPQGNALNNLWLFPRLSVLKPYFIKALNFLDKNNYNINIAACGQFPLCLVPKFEKEALKNIDFSEKNILGVVGGKAFHEFEMADRKWQKIHKTKTLQCRKCILNKICPGLWEKYVELYAFDGIKSLTFDNFQGIKFSASLMNDHDLMNIKEDLNKNKLNVVKLLNYTPLLFKKLLNYIQDDKIMVVVLDKSGKVIN